MTTKLSKNERLKNMLANRAIIEAALAGEDFEFKNDNGFWIPGSDSLRFVQDPSRYRIKPKPQLHDCNAKVYIICRHDDGEVFTRKTKKSAMRVFHQQRKAGFKVTLDVLTKTVKYEE